MKREFIELPSFQKAWKDLGLGDDELLKLEGILLLAPDQGEMIQGTGGLRKIRWAFPRRGKRGSVRVVYVDFLHYEKTYLISVYAKSTQTDLSLEQKKKIRSLIQKLRNELRRRDDHV